MRIEIFEPKHFAGGVADELAITLGEIVDDQGTCSIALSGGSTPGVVYRALGLPPRVEEIPWNDLKFFLGDERFVPPDDSRSNYKMVQETLFSTLREQKPKLFPVNTKLSNCAASANDYAEILTKEIPCDKGIPIFDVMILGVGEDGHTASLFPGTPSVNDTSAVCVCVPHPTDGTQRISLGRHVIVAAKRIFFLAKGASKAEIIQRVIEGTDSPDIYPSRIFTEAQDKVTWFLDSEAAAKLKI